MDIEDASWLMEGEPRADSRAVGALVWAVVAGYEQRALTPGFILQIHLKMCPMGGSTRDQDVVLLNVSGDMPVKEQPVLHHMVMPTLIAWCKRYDRPLTDLEICVAHRELMLIHPFFDGNGRVGRIVMNYMAARNGLMWFKAIPELRGRYFRGLNEANPSLVLSAFERV